MRKILPALMLALSTLPAVALAEAPAAPKAQTAEQPSAAQQDLLQLRQAIMVLERDIAMIQQKTLKAHPELAKQRDALTKLIGDTARANGFDPDATIKRMQELRQRYQAKDVTAAEKKTLAAEYTKKQSAMRQAMQTVAQDQKVEAARKKFIDAMTVAMRKTDAKTDGLLKDLKAKQLEFRSKLVAAMQQGQAGSSK